MLLLFFNRPPDAIIELPSIVNRHLISIMDTLKTRDMDQIKFDANLLLQIGDDIYELVTAYMDFVDSIYLDIQRHGTFNEEKIT